MMKYRIRNEEEEKASKRNDYAMWADVDALSTEIAHRRIDRITKSGKLSKEIKDRFKDQVEAMKAEADKKRHEANIHLSRANVPDDKLQAKRREALEYGIGLIEEQHANKTMLIEEYTAVGGHETDIDTLQDEIIILEIEHEEAVKELDKLPAAKPDPRREEIRMREAGEWPLPEEKVLPRTVPEVMGEPEVDPKEESDAIGKKEPVKSKAKGKETTGP